ncbi:MAG: threonylcarbamoyl-AMP synthase [Anaerolineales bacterium]|nr:threonylcarbamoyl-AMP synthase [Anaerolineales bacterium]
MKTEIIHAHSSSAQRRAVEVLQAGGLVAFPTDTVYGLAMMPWSPQAVSRCYQAKRRPSDRPIPLLLSDQKHLPRVAVLPDWFKGPFVKAAALFWPGALTIVLPKTEIVLDEVSHGPTVAVRVPDLEVTRSIIELAGGILAVTSANLSGQPSPVTASEVMEQLGGRIELILDGGHCRAGVPSTVVDCSVVPPRVLRHGAIATAVLEAALGAIEDCRGE